jgi:S-adenosyl methyltransferase
MSKFSNPAYHSNTATLYSAALDDGDFHSKSDSFKTWLMGLITPFPEKMRINRAFVKEMYSYYNSQGFENILDIGAGPMPRGHEWAPNVNIIYVDHNPEITAHARQKLPPHSSTIFETSSVKDLPKRIKDGLFEKRFNSSRKVAIGSTAVLMFVDDDVIRETFAFLYNQLESGSRIRITTTAITASENKFQAKMIRRFFKFVNAPMHIRNIDNFVKLFGPWKLSVSPMPCWKWLNWPPSKNTAGVGFDIYAMEFIKP